MMRGNHRACVRRNRAGGVLAALSLAVLAYPGPGQAGSIANSKHNLSVSGKGAVKASTETEICIFCHSAHNTLTDTPLWNRESSGRQYTPYSSSTAKALHGQPTGASKLCLSCHDGTVALGAVKNRSHKIKFEKGVETLPPGRKNIGLDLGDDHPVSFVYDAALTERAKHQLVPPQTLQGAVRLDKSRQIQCTTCHDPHDDQNAAFLVVENKASALCLSCHKIDLWETSSHSVSVARWNGRDLDPWPQAEWQTVADNGCENCHAAHGAGGKSRLLKFAMSENNCYACHNGNVAKYNIKADFDKFSAHPIQTTRGLHDPVEDLKNPPRHVACMDCHNPHATRSTQATAAQATAPQASGALTGVKGVSAEGGEVHAVTAGYELCFRCHAESNQRGAARIRRQDVQTNTRLEFSPSSASYHPLEALGKNPDVPSLLAPWKTTSLMDCTDCHNNDEGSREGGRGADGPHGSLHTPLLARKLVMTDSLPESAAAYALCYKCHSRDSLLRNDSFPQHGTHIAMAACTTCHDPHAAAGTAHLINFNLDYVSPYKGTIEFRDEGRFKGSCTLTCHKRDHDRQGYGYGDEEMAPPELPPPLQMRKRSESGRNQKRR